MCIWVRLCVYNCVIVSVCAFVCFHVRIRYVYVRLRVDANMFAFVRFCLFFFFFFFILASSYEAQNR